MTALGAGSWLARRWLGLPLIEPGAPADLVAYRRDPRESLDVLAEPAVVILGGRLVRPARPDQRGEDSPDCDGPPWPTPAGQRPPLARDGRA